ncbi:Sugar phosphate permease [Chitinasiproducens palmae]|uniref:Sugar phosphate permease n=2 Tax=Chitinasiproducens palmae TaxID=1770053 RepID=A0A1H2PJK5_9BURK|nr:Sugar phosphate permease [Chitinasiproducens palmae]
MGNQQSHVSRNMLAIFCAMSFILYLDRVNLAAAAGPIKAELGLSNTTLGLAFSAFGYTYAIFQLVGGWVADRFGARRTLLVCGSLWVVATIATGMIGGLVSLCLARLLLGVGEGAALPAQARAITNWVAKPQRGMVQGLTHSFSRLGNAVAPPLVAVLIALHSWRAAFFVVGAMTAVWLVIWFLYYRDDPRQHPGVSQAELARLPIAETLAANDAEPRARWGAILRRMRPTIGVYFCMVWSNTLFFSWMPIFFMQSQHLNIKDSALYSSGVFLAGVVGDLLGGVISDQLLKRTGRLAFARQSVIVVSMLGGLACFIPVLISHDVVVIASCLSGAFFFLELTIGPIWAVPMDIAPREAGTASGMLNFGAAMATIISPIVFGAVIDYTGSWTLPFAGAIGFLVLGAILALFIRPDRKVVRDLPPVATVRP